MDGTFCISRHREPHNTCAKIVFTPTEENTINVMNISDAQKIHSIFQEMWNTGFLSSTFEIEVNENISYKHGIIVGGFCIDVLSCEKTFLPATGDYGDMFRTYLENFVSQIMRSMRFIGNAHISIYQNVLGSVVSSFIDPGNKKEDIDSVR